MAKIDKHVVIENVIKRNSKNCSGIKPIAEQSMRNSQTGMKKVLIYERRNETKGLLLDCYKYAGYDAKIISDDNEIPQNKYDLLVTEIEDCSGIVQKAASVNPGIRIIIFSNFSRDTFIEEIFHKKGITGLVRDSYKVKDLLKMSDIAVNIQPFHLFGLESYMSNREEESIVRSLDFKLRKERVEEYNIGETLFTEIEKFIHENGLHNSIEDIDMLHYAIGELIDNSIEAQVKSGKPEIEISCRYGFDETQFGFSIRDKLGTLSHKNVVSGIGMKIYDQSGGTPPEHYYENTYVGPRGRGYYIVQYSVHRLSVVIITPETAEKYNINPCTEATIMVYFNKKMDEELQIGPCGISMVVTI